SAREPLVSASAEQAPRAAWDDALELEQLALDRQPAAVAGQRAVAADDAVTRDDDRDRVAAVREANGPHGLRLADRARDVGIGRRPSVAHIEQRVPDPPLERRSLERERHVELPPLAREVLAKLPGDGLERPGVLVRVGRRGLRPASGREADLAQRARFADQDQVPDRARDTRPASPAARLPRGGVCASRPSRAGGGHATAATAPARGRSTPAAASCRGTAASSAPRAPAADRTWPCRSCGSARRRSRTTR